MYNTEKIKEWHSLIVEGLNNGLTHTNKDGRTDTKEFWQKRSVMFDTFAHCVMRLVWEQDYTLEEKELKRITKEEFQK